MIRLANENDAAAVASLIGQLGYELTTDDARTRLGSSAVEAVYLAEKAGRVIGLIQVAVTEGLEHEARGEIRALVIDENHRSGGMGRELIDAAEAWAKERGLSKMRVRSNVKRERARKFYERNGYVVTKTQNVFDKKL